MEYQPFDCNRCRRQIKKNEAYLIDIDGKTRHKYIETCRTMVAA